MHKNDPIAPFRIRPLVILAAALVLLGLGCSKKVSVSDTNTPTESSEDETLTDNTNEAVVPEDSAASETNDATDTNNAVDTSGNTNDGTNDAEEVNTEPTQPSPVVTDKPAKLAEYSDQTLADAKNYGRTVLFFYASWDQISKDAEADILANLGTLPAGVTVLKVNYGSADALKKQYGVTYQHSFVQIDAKGNKVTLWSGADAASIADNIQ